MRLTNLTPYDTRTLRRIVTAIWKYKWGKVRTAGWEKIRVIFYIAGRKVNPRHRGDGCYVMRLPKLTGHEWVHLLRQKDGIESRPGPNEGPPETQFIGLCVAQMFAFQFFAAALVKAKIPPLLPLKTPVMRKAQAQISPVRKRYQRVLVLERTWLRRHKLATTKIKKLRVRRKYYEKKLGI